jgi:hypothetical protein
LGGFAEAPAPAFVAHLACGRNKPADGKDECDDETRRHDYRPMRHDIYDAVIVGARCAGAPTAMLLARTGYQVLLLDRASFPSDTISTHIIWPHGDCRASELTVPG